MRLGKLLGAGKSFFGWRESVSYRQNKHIYLPKFNSDKNPFGLKPADKSAAPAKTKNVPAVSAPGPVKAAAQTQKIFMPPAAATGVRPAAAPAPKPVRAGWTAKLNPFRPPQPVAPPMVNAVQTELSLDSVKVLHNDLSDADVEVVPAKSRSAAPKPAPSGFLSEHILKTV